MVLLESYKEHKKEHWEKKLRLCRSEGKWLYIPLAEGLAIEAILILVGLGPPSWS
jgi:hypothetical protein